MSISAYKNTVRRNAAPREIERQIFSRITAQLSVHGPAYDGAEKIQRLSLLAGGLQIALFENVRLWMAIKNDLSHDDNKLPPELRANLISLALFVENHTRKLLSGTGEVESLTAVNQLIISGLASEAA